MSKATLFFRISSKGNPVVEYQLKNGGVLKIIPSKLGLPTDCNGKPANIEMDLEGKVIGVTLENTLYGEKFVPPPIEENLVDELIDAQVELESENFVRDTTRKPARAPYNFIPLNEKALPGQGNKNHDTFSSECKSGYIVLNITTKTPLFIRGKKDQFLKLNGKPIIPGSSLRGLIRTMIEITSYGKLHFVDSRKLYYRNSVINAIDRELHKAGFLLCKQVNGEKKYYITYVDMPRTQLNAARPITPDYDSTNKNAWIYTTFRNRTYLFAFTYPANPQMIAVDDEIIEGYKNDDTRDKKIVNLVTKSEDNLTYPKGVPVFCILKKAGDGSLKIDSFGHSKYYRVPYTKSIMDHIPKEINKSDQPDLRDFTDSIFGHTDYSGKVYFENATCEDNPPVFLGKSLPKILSSPNPTSYQLYLEQVKFHGHNDSWQVKKSEVKNWNREAPIRGNKMYWHKITPPNGLANSWREADDVIKSDSHADEIDPIIEGTIFQSRIRFNNLTDEELGALLFSLDLPKDTQNDEYCHKLGMGKPLGLGSIKIKTSIILIDRKKRYLKLFDGETNDWNLAEENKDTEKDIYKNKFAANILRSVKNNSSIAENNATDLLWKEPRLIQLKTMLNFKNQENHNINISWLDRTRYLKIDKIVNDQKVNEYKEREVLPFPDEVERDTTYDSP